MPLEEAVDKAVTECIDKNILRDILSRERAAVMLDILTTFDEKEYAEGLKAISEADTLIVAGTSLKVYPANSMINCFRGKNLIVINKDHLDIDADIQINDSIGNVFKQIKTKD